MTGTTRPLYIRMHAADDVAIVVNDGGVPAGTVFEDGLTVREAVPQGHKVALADLPAGSAVRRYNVVIGHTTRDVPAGSWVHERLLQMPLARSLDGLPVSTVRPAPQAALEGYTFEGYRNPDGSVAEIRNWNSVLNKPTPSAPVVAKAAMSSRKPAFIIKVTGTPSVVTDAASRIEA